MMRVEQVDVWLDCGKTETVLETNRYLLEHGQGNNDAAAEQGREQGFLVVPPVNIHPTAHIRNSVIGPHATVAANCRVENSIVRDSILDEEAEACNALLAGSLIGRTARVRGRFRAFNVGEASEVGFE
jgi:glucose-1-phosphate thymidylyltransferase